ncbi:MAG TPA: amino acid ABC transporter permease [Candidatus Limnocylindrales bacterium]|nr:amino acid ABC transporter permease [Candidatus Limnocylindrales bacterium]
MTTTTGPRPIPPTVVHPDAPPRPRPILTTGPLAWMRKNLFATPFDAALTVIVGVILITMTVSFLTWSIGQANWFVITRNVRLFMAGTFPLEEMWRVDLVALISAFGVGYSIYAFVRPPRWLVWALAWLALALVIIPVAVNALAPRPPSLMAAGAVPVESGTVTETPLEQVAFVGQAGQSVSFEIYAASDDPALANAAGFSDRAAQSLTNAARNRLSAAARLDELNEQLTGDLLTDTQRADAETTRDRLSIPPSPVDTYALNSAPVLVRLLNPDTLEPVAETELTAGDPAWSVTLPYDGWYVLEKVVAGDSVALLRVINTEPAVPRAVLDGLGYSRVIDDFTTTAARPQADGRDMPFNALTDNQWQGNRTLGEFLVMFAAPMLLILASGLIPLLALGVVGYGAAWGLGRIAPRPPRQADNPQWPARRTILALWVLAGALAALLLIGLPGAGPVAVGSTLARFVWVGWLFFVGVALNRAWGRPLFVLLMVLGLMQSLLDAGVLDGRVPLGALGTGGLLSLVINFAIWFGIGVFAARQGVASRGLFNTKQAIRAILVCAALWLALLIVPALLAGASNGTGEPLPAIDTRRWGGLLLTMAITIVALVVSFPLGIGLALGRRSSLPLVRGVCTAYIELVRGVPLITVLFMAMLLVPLINPNLASVENVFRAMVGFTLFSAAYLAENVRGGLQSVPPGQEEAARALGLSGWQVILLITLPQALRAVIPALVGQAISLFKDTSLVALVGLTDLTGISKAVIAQPEYVGLQSEVYVFISIIYFIFSYAMAYVSRRIEASGSGTARRL